VVAISVNTFYCVLVQPKKSSEKDPRNTASRSEVCEISAEQKKEIREAFDLFDSNGSGSIDENQLKAAMRALGFKPKEEEIAKIIEGVDNKDNNNSGIIGFPKFVEIMAAKMRTPPVVQEDMKIIAGGGGNQTNSSVEKEVGSGDQAKISDWPTVEDVLTHSNISKASFEKLPNILSLLKLVQSKDTWFEHFRKLGMKPGHAARIRRTLLNLEMEKFIRSREIVFDLQCDHGRKRVGTKLSFSFDFGKQSRLGFEILFPLKEKVKGKYSLILPPESKEGVEEKEGEGRMEEGSLGWAPKRGMRYRCYLNLNISGKHTITLTEKKFSSRRNFEHKFSNSRLLSQFASKGGSPLKISAFARQVGVHNYKSKVESLTTEGGQVRLTAGPTTNYIVACDVQFVFEEKKWSTGLKETAKADDFMDLR